MRIYQPKECTVSCCFVHHVVDLLGLLADALDGAAGARVVVVGSRVVVPELDQDEVTRLDERERALPMALGQIGAGC